MNWKLTRDSALLWVLAFAALAAYLKSVGTPPTAWTYDQWLQFIIAAAGWSIGKLQSSKLPSSAEVARGFRDSGEPL